jgi:hypothetical protein
MSGHNTEPGPQPRHARHPAIRAAAAAIILLALGACSSTATTPATSTAASAGPSGGPGTLTGAGSTYVAPFFALAFARYHQHHPAVTVSYSAVGSSAGIAAISARQVDFGASDVPMNAGELAAAQGGPITQVPDAQAAIMPHRRPSRGSAWEVSWLPPLVHHAAHLTAALQPPGVAWRRVSVAPPVAGLVPRRHPGNSLYAERTVGGSADVVKRGQPIEGVHR